MELNNVDLNKIAVFCQVVDAGGYQRAAERVHVTPSALSQTITGLEASLGFALFDRRGRKLVPTARGLQLHREFRLHQGQFLKGLALLRGQQGVVSGQLRIGAYLEFAKSQLTRPLKKFIQDFPDANVKMIFDSPTRLQALLNQGQLDLCFSIFPSKEKKTVESRRIFQQELVMIAKPRVLPAAPTLQQVLEIPVIDYFANHQPIRRWIQLHYDKRPKKIPVRIFSATAEMVVSLVREGTGLGVVPKYLVEGEVAGLTIVRPTAKKLNDYIWLLERTGSESSPVHAAFRSQILNHFSNSQGDLSGKAAPEK